MCPPGYHHNGFVATYADGHMMYITPILLLWDLSTHSMCRGSLMTTYMTNVFWNLLFFNTPSLFVGWSRKLKVHRANSQTISSYPVRFSKDTVPQQQHFLSPCFLWFLFFCFLWFILVFVCVCVFFVVIFFETKNIYFDTHWTIRVGRW